MGAEVFKGIKGVDTSTAMFIDNPRRALEVTNAANSGKPEDEWIGIEMYPIRSRIVRDLLSDLAKVIALSPPIPEGVTAKKIREWQKESPNTYVSRIHLPFSYDVADLWARGLGDLKNPRHFLWMEAMGAATNRYAIKLAQDLQDLQDKPVGITAHTNIIEGFARDGMLGEVKQKVAFVLAESTVRNKTSVKMSQEDLYDPISVAKLAKRHELFGMVFGVDHAREEEVDIENALESTDVKETMHSFHVGERHHDLVAIGNVDFAKFFAKAAETEFHHPVRATLDYDPRIVKKISPSAQLELIRSTKESIMSFQNP